MGEVTLSSAFSALPRRYEDTKPAINQAFTHKSIISIGEQISTKERQLFDAELQRALEEREREVWARAEVYKDECVTKALGDAKDAEDFMVRRMNIEHETALRKESLRTEGVCRKEASEALYQQKTQCDKHLNETVAQLRAVLADEKAEAIAATQREERDVARRHVEDLDMQHRLEMEDRIAFDERTKQQELSDLRDQMTDEMNAAVDNAERQQQAIAEQRLNQMSAEFTSKVQHLQAEVNDLQQQLARSARAFDAMEEMKESYVRQLNGTRHAFTSFIEGSRTDFHAGQADFLLPPNLITSDDLVTT